MHNHLTQPRPLVCPSDNVLMLRHVHAYLYVGPAKDLVMGLSAHDQTFALRVDLKEITELSGVKKQAGAELYPKLSKKCDAKNVTKNVRKPKCDAKNVTKMSESQRVPPCFKSELTQNDLTTLLLH